MARSAKTAADFPEGFWADDSLQRVLRFVRRFGKPHLALAAHAAVPLGLTPDLVHLTRVNFARSAPPIAEADLLLSPLCQEVGGEMYEMLPGVRELLLRELVREHGVGALKRAAEFLHAYAAHYLRLAHDEEARDFLEAQMWAAQAYLHPKGAAESLASALGEGLAGSETARALRVAGVTRALSAPLITEGKFVVYATAVEELTGADGAHARRLMKTLGPWGEDVKIGGVTLPSPDSLARALKPGLGPEPETDTEAGGPEPAHEDEAPAPPGLRLRHTLRGHRGGIVQAVWTFRGDILFTAGLDGMVNAWDPTQGKQRSSEPPSVQKWVTSLATSADGMLIYCGTAKGGLEAVQVRRMSPTFEAEGKHTGPITSIAVTADGSRVVTASMDGTARVWAEANLPDDVGWTPQVTRVFEGHKAGLTAVALTPDGRVAVTASWDGTLKLWDMEDGRLRGTLEGHRGSVNAVVVTPDGRAAISASDDATIRVWDLESLKPLRILEGHLAFITGLAISRDGGLLASKSADDTVRLWAWNTGQMVAQLYEPMPDGSASGAVAFHPSEPLLATLGDGDRAVRLWEFDREVLLGQERAESLHYVTAKVALVGDSGVGKSAIGLRLVNDEFREQSSLHGQQFWVLPGLDARRQDGAECEAVLWDLAGQPDYRLIHSLFLGDVDVALLVFDATDVSDPLRAVRFWLSQLRKAADSQPAELRGEQGAPRIILVGARADRGQFEMSREELDEFCKQQGIEGGFVLTSAKSGEGMEELRSRIQSLIPWDELPATTTVLTFKRIRDYVLRLKEDAKGRQVVVSLRELRASLQATDEAWQFSDGELSGAVGGMASHGYVSMLPSPGGAGRVLLFPELLNNLAASFVLEARRNPEGLGALEERRLLSGGYSFPELERLPPEDRDVLLNSVALLFLERNVCFRETDPQGEKSYLVFPELINQKRPLADEEPTEEGPAYVVSGAVENLFASLTILLGYTQTFTRRNQWQNQARYVMADGSVCGFRQDAEREGELDFVLYFGANVARPVRTLFQGLFESFLARRNLSVARFEPVVCSKGHTLNRAVVRDEVRRGKESAFCEECGEKVALKGAGEPIQLAEQPAEVEEQRRLAELRTQFERALFRIQSFAHEESLEAPNCYISYAQGEARDERWVTQSLAPDLKKAGIRVALGTRGSPSAGETLASIFGALTDEHVIMVVGTSAYMSGSRPAGGEIQGALERLEGVKAAETSFLPLLLEGEENTSFPPLLRGRVYTDFRREEAYFASLLDVILTVYKIPFDHPAVSEFRTALRPPPDPSRHAA
ncbi:MAG TPA: TIR domain-containing protein [Pyrinomonadaceae bacterium]|nr:TIR domain-containing protein [Pyrinomonadaceae bacterium]